MKKADKIYEEIKKRVVDEETLKLVNEYSDLQIEIEEECNQ